MNQLKLLPKSVAISLGVSVVALVALVLSVIFVGGALSDNEAENTRLKAERDAITKSLQVSDGDYKFASENRARFEAVLNSEKLVPHTRVNAAQQFEAIARQRGLESLNYSFSAVADQSLASVKSQPATGGYKVSVESVDLKFAAALDTTVYGFLLDISDNFPGAVVIQSLTLSRTPSIDESALDRLSHGLSSNIVSGEAKVLWRTAQAVEQSPTAQGAAKK